MFQRKLTLCKNIRILAYLKILSNFNTWYFVLLQEKNHLKMYINKYKIFYVTIYFS